MLRSLFALGVMLAGTPTALLAAHANTNLNNNAVSGADSAVVGGLDRPVEWSRASLTEVFLYVPYTYVVVPKRH